MELIKKAVCWAALIVFSLADLRAENFSNETLSLMNAQALRSRGNRGNNGSMRRGPSLGRRPSPGVGSPSRGRVSPRPGGNPARNAPIRRPVPDFDGGRRRPDPRVRPSPRPSPIRRDPGGPSPVRPSPGRPSPARPSPGLPSPITKNPGTNLPARRPPSVQLPDGRNVARPIVEPRLPGNSSGARRAHLQRPAGPHPSVAIGPGLSMPGNRVISHLARPAHIPVAPGSVSVGVHVGQARVRAYGRHHHNYHIYYWSNHYWGHHHDHFDYWHVDHGYWWCSHYNVYLDWGYPPVFVEHMYVNEPPAPSQGYLNIGPGQTLYHNGQTFHWWDGGSWRLLVENQLLSLDSSLYFRHRSASEDETHYDRFIPDAELFYCSEHGTYYRALFFSRPDYVFVPDYDLWWADAEQMYHGYLLLSEH